MYHAYFSDGLNALNRQLSIQAETVSPLESLGRQYMNIRHRCPVLTLEMLGEVPNHGQSNVLFRTWLSGFQLFNPLMDMSNVLDKYQEFWHWYEHRGSEDKVVPDSGYVPLIFAIWFAGCMCMSKEGFNLWFPQAERHLLSAHFQDKVMKFLNLLSFPQASSLHKLSAFLTVLASRESSQDTLSTGVELGLALRVAQSMGLHRDPKRFSLASWEINTRRQIWWHILQADSALALATGLPVLVDDRDFWDTKSASQVEELQREDSSSCSHRRLIARQRNSAEKTKRNLRLRELTLPSTNSRSFVPQQAYPLELTAARDLVRIRRGTHPVGQMDIERARYILTTLEHDMKTIIKRLILSETTLTQQTSPECVLNHCCSADTSSKMLWEPTHFDLELEYVHTQQKETAKPLVEYHLACLSSFHRWLRLYILLVIDKLYCLFYQPFLKSLKSDMWPFV
ncbi:hypothetical protein EDD36DRAFT_492326 [Exophiala viscosa]|uniref:Xylanolytic transcriptional activator regulatory domain-containing protein n=1 Tax=Exophiala viscosa TaxID=2486360 RepID=A0AAN6E7I3_9EURO|nr:hypothetical protein EDD36DRAFT_492326 [Exophiala viscosa]